MGRRDTSINSLTDPGLSGNPGISRVVDNTEETKYLDETKYLLELESYLDIVLDNFRTKPNAMQAIIENIQDYTKSKSDILYHLNELYEKYLELNNTPMINKIIEVGQKFINFSNEVDEYHMAVVEFEEGLDDVEDIIDFDKDIIDDLDEDVKEVVNEESQKEFIDSVVGELLERRKQGNTLLFP